MAVNENMAMLQIDEKERQRRENYKRAEAFLYWKFGPYINEINQYLFGSRGPHRGESLAAFMVEFVERVEEDLLTQNRHIMEQHMQYLQMKIATGIDPIIMRKEDIYGPEPKPSK